MDDLRSAALRDPSGCQSLILGDMISYQNDWKCCTMIVG
jgi:hypothetical protein